MMYVAIDEGYEVKKLNGIEAVIEACKNYTTVNGQKIDRKTAMKELKKGALKVYEYEEDELLEAVERGRAIGTDWTLIIRRLL